MIRSLEEFVTLRTSNDPAEYQRSVVETAPDKVWQDIIESRPDMKVWVVLNKTVPVAILQQLAQDPDPDVRAAVARTRRTPPQVLEELAADSDATTRLAVAVNRSTPTEVLQRLCGDTWDEVKRVATDRIASRKQ